MVKRIDSRRIDLTDQQFGELKVIKLSEKRGTNNTLLWQCRCLACGREDVYVAGGGLRAGTYKSCGCMQPEKRDHGARTHEQSDMIDGTRRTALKAKLHKDNKSGIKGVMWQESKQRWKAYIGFRGKQISLGSYHSKDDAIAARKAGEEKYHKPYLEGQHDD